MKEYGILKINEQKDYACIITTFKAETRRDASKQALHITDNIERETMDVFKLVRLRPGQCLEHLSVV